MNKKVIAAVISILAIGAVVIVASSFKAPTNNNSLESQDTTSQAQSPASSEAEAAQEQAPSNTELSDTSPGTYISYEEYLSNKESYKNSTVVYFFNAKWCPTCQVLTKDITASITDIPDNVVIVSVDYDEYTDLKKQYGVTIQHTLVQIDASGNAIQKWSGGNTLESILSKV